MFWTYIFPLIIIFFISLLIYNYDQISKPSINKINIKSKKIKQTIKLTQITDFHSNYRINLDRLFQSIKQYGPNIILLTGDIVDHKTEDFNIALDLIKRTKKITENVFFVAGNHENRNVHYKTLHEEMLKLGVTILENNSKILEINGEKINIAGVEFTVNQEEYIDTLNKMDPNNFTLLLSHSPTKPIEYLTGKEDLILSGHTHGGQVRLPLIGAIIAPGQGLFPKHDKGIIEMGDTTLYIDSGLGNSAYPIRLFNPVQITNIMIDSIS